MAKVYVTRHGQTYSNARGQKQNTLWQHRPAHVKLGSLFINQDKLNSIGKAQAVRLGSHLASRGVTSPVFVTSQLLRTKQTAAIAAEQMHIDFKIYQNVRHSADLNDDYPVEYVEKYGPKNPGKKLEYWLAHRPTLREIGNHVNDTIVSLARPQANVDHVVVVHESLLRGLLLFHGKQMPDEAAFDNCGLAVFSLDRAALELEEDYIFNEHL